MIPIKKYFDLRPLIKSGDILLCSGSGTFSKLIQQTTKSPWSHVGFILHIPNIDRLMVLESVESIGIRTVPLSHYVNDYNASGLPYPGKMLIARHDKFIADEIGKLSNRAIDLLDFPYDKDEIIKLFTLYASGSDAHIKLIEWNKLTSIEPVGEHSAFFIFEEPAEGTVL